MSFFSGIVDSCDRVHLGGYPGPFRDMLGLRITEFWPPPAGESVPITFTDGARASGALWSEWIELAGAEPIARFSGGDLDGLPAITRHQYGDGVAWYLGTRPEPASMARILREAAEGAGVRPVLPDLPDGVEATVRRMDSGGRRLFVLNHNATAVTVTLPAGGVDLLTGEPLAAETTLPPRGVVIAALNPHTGQSIS